MEEATPSKILRSREGEYVDLMFDWNVHNFVLFPQLFVFQGGLETAMRNTCPQLRREEHERMMSSDELSHVN